MKKLLTVAAAIASIGFASQANAFVADSILFDRDGAGAGGAVAITSFTWLAGNALSVDAIGSTTGAFTTYYQAALNSFVFNSGGGSTTYSPLFGEFTVQAVINEQVINALGTQSAEFLTTGGTYNIYFDPLTNPATQSNDISGLGYGNDAGSTLILSGNILPGGSGDFNNFTIGYREQLANLTAIFIGLGQTPAQAAATALGILGAPSAQQTVVPLDAFGTDNLPGTLTHQGNGNSDIEIDVTYINTDFFKTDITTLTVDMADSTGVTTPFKQGNPSAEVMGNTPVYGVEGDNPTNGAACRDGTATCDFHFQTIATTSFARAVPEPGSLAIAGAGLALMSLIRRRKSK